MPRPLRLIAPGLPHHVTQRGNNREVVFIDDQDRRIYLSWLLEYSQKFQLKFWAYCLMINHVHFIAIPEEENSIAKTLAALHTKYATYFNRKTKRVGHLWQGRYFSSILDERYLLAAVRYVERNPVRSGLVKKAEDYAWSSAKAHVLGIKDPLLGDCPLLEEININQWSNYLSDDEDFSSLKYLRDCSWRGRPTGDKNFLFHLEKLLARKIITGPVGRPRIKIGV